MFTVNPYSSDEQNNYFIFNVAWKKLFPLFFGTAFIIAEGALGNVGNLSNTISYLCQSTITFMSMIVKY